MENPGDGCNRQLCGDAGLSKAQEAEELNDNCVDLSLKVQTHLYVVLD